MEQINDLTFLLSDREIEVIDELYPMEIETFTKHITKIKCGYAYCARFNPGDHIVNVCHWIKKSIGYCRNQRIRNDDFIDIGDVEDLESHLSWCILKHDEERDRVKLTKKDDTDQTVPNEHSDVHDVPEENGGQDPNASLVLPEVMDDKDKDVLSGDSTEKSESKSASGEDSDNLKDKHVLGGDSKDESKEKPESKSVSGEDSDDLKDTGVISDDSKDESKEKPESKHKSGENSDDLKDTNVISDDSKEKPFKKKDVLISGGLPKKGLTNIKDLFADDDNQVDDEILLMATQDYSQHFNDARDDTNESSNCKESESAKDLERSV